MMGAGTRAFQGRGDDMGKGLEVKEGKARVGCTLATLSLGVRVDLPPVLLFISVWLSSWRGLP